MRLRLRWVVLGINWVRLRAEALEAPLDDEDFGSNKQTGDEMVEVRRWR